MWATLILDFARRPRCASSFSRIARFFSWWVLYQKSIRPSVRRRLAFPRRRSACAGFCFKGRGDLLIRSFAIEQLRELPLAGRKPEKVDSCRVAECQRRVRHRAHLRARSGPDRAAADGCASAAPWDFGQCRVESFAQVHGARRTCIVMPGFSSGDGCTTAPITCTLPLAGSTTGLTRAMRPV